MSRLALALGRQLSEPSGLGGWLAAQAMRVANRRVLAAAISALDVQPGDAVVDLGCGAGDALPHLAQASRGGALYGVDHAPGMLAAAQRRCRHATPLRADFRDLPLGDASIDRILAVNVAYFWWDDRAVMAELRRILKPAGKLVVYVTDGAALRRVGLAETNTHRMIDGPTLRSMLGHDATIRPIVAMAGVRGWLAELVRTGRPANRSNGDRDRGPSGGSDAELA